MFFMIGIGLGIVLLVLVFLAFVFRNIWFFVVVAVVGFVAWKFHDYVYFTGGDPKLVELRIFKADRVYPPESTAPTWQVSAIARNNQSKTVTSMAVRVRLRYCERDVFSTSISGDDKACEGVGNEIVRVSVTIPPTETREIRGQVVFNNVPGSQPGTPQLTPEVDSVVTRR